ncbi:hypothetical protein Nepgr_014636 [Nepenthes gracilis]|uniref:Uncharacterized protein n=1 Tax=Nepenthes gracilis TaxID=150966 RepID=A0AAD3XQN9_NEPGR|nr:hypothetical protein Nepgr_014636 [Nepenthes gracilis]
MAEILDNPNDDVRKASSEALRNESEASENARREEGRENDIEESQFDPNKMRKTKPGVKRLLLSLSVLLSLLFVKDSNFDVDLKNDELVDEFLASVLVGGEKCLYSTGKVYSVVVLNTDGEIKAVVGKHRHGWILGKISVANAIKTIAKVFVKVFINGGKEEGSIHGEFLCDAWCSANGNYIALCNVISFGLRSRGFI